MFGNDEQHNLHVISVLKTYFADCKRGQLERIQAGEKIMAAIVAPHQRDYYDRIEKAMKMATASYPMPDEGETVHSILSWDFLTTELSKTILLMAPRGFDFTLLLLGYIHYHVPSFTMIYNKEVKKEKPALDTLQLFDVCCNEFGTHRVVALSFADKSLTKEALKRFSAVSSGDAGVVTLFEAETLVSTLSPIFEKYGIQISYDIEDKGFTVKPITFEVPETIEKKDFLALLADLTIQGVSITAQPEDKQDQAKYEDIVLEKLAEKWLEDKDTTFCLKMIKNLRFSDSPNRTELLCAIIDFSLENRKVSELRAAYAMLPSPKKAHMANLVAEKCLCSEVSNLRREAAYFLSESGRSPYRRFRIYENVLDVDSVVAERHHPSVLCSKRVEMNAVTQDDQLNQFTWYDVEYLDEQNKHRMT